MTKTQPSEFNKVSLSLNNFIDAKRKVKNNTDTTENRLSTDRLSHSSSLVVKTESRTS
jgi:hypothetical protein